MSELAAGERALLPLASETSEMADERANEGAGATATKDGNVGYTIDELAAKSRVPSRTIRFYQSRGVLPKPVLRGRVAVYTDAHVERLRLVEELQDRGLQIKAIGEVMARLDKGELAINEWLGLEDQLKEPWANDKPKLLEIDELRAIAADVRPGRIAELVRIGLVERKGDAFLVPSPALLQIAFKLESSGVPIDVSSEASAVLRKHLKRAAHELTEVFVRRASEGGWQHLGEAMQALRPSAMEVLRILFAQEIERELRHIVETGATAKLARKSR